MTEPHYTLDALHHAWFFGWLAGQATILLLAVVAAWLVLRFGGERVE